MKTNSAIRILLILALSLSILGEVAGARRDLSPVHGKLALAGTVNVKSLSYSAAASSNWFADVPLASGPTSGPRLSPTLQSSSVSNTSSVSSSIGFDGINQAQ